MVKHSKSSNPKAELKNELVTREILRAELAELKADMTRNFYAALLAATGIIIAAMFAIVKL